MNWVQRKIYLYNVTFGLYMLDWWERYLFNILVIVLMWFVFYNWSRYVNEFFKSLMKDFEDNVAHLVWLNRGMYGENQNRSRWVDANVDPHWEM